MSNWQSGLIECNRVELTDLCADAVKNIKQYRKDAVSLWENWAIRHYTKRWIIRDRTPKEAIQYARDVPFNDYWFYANAYSNTLDMVIVHGNVASALENDNKTMFVTISDYNKILKWAKEPPVPEI